MQEFYEKVGNQDMRIIANEFFISLAYIRRSVDGWRTNCGLGNAKKIANNRIKLDSLPRELQDMAVHSVRAFGGGVLGVDIALVKDNLGKSFFTEWEANCCFDYAKAQEIFSVDVAESIIDYVYLKFLEHRGDKKEFLLELNRLKNKYYIRDAALDKWIYEYEKCKVER